MRRQRGFTLIEATITAVILMVGIIALVQVGRASTSQITEIRQTLGQPAIAERLIHDQIEAIMTPADAPAAPNIPGVPPVGLGGAVYGVDAFDTGCPAVAITIMKCYRITATFNGQPFKAGPNAAPDVYIWRPISLP